MILRHGILVMLLVSAGLVALGQEPDTLYDRSPAIQWALQKYTESLGGQEMIYSGVQYIEYGQHMKGYPFFLTEDWEDGTVWYDGRKYWNVPLLYDISRDEVVIKHFDQNGMSVKIKIYQPKVSRFSFLNHTFFRLNRDSINNLTTGYYEELYAGKTRLIARHIKNRVDETTESGASLTFNAKDHYFMYRDGKYFRVSGMNSVLKLMKDRKSEVKQFVKSSGLEFKDNREKDFIAMASFYDRN